MLRAIILCALSLLVLASPAPAQSVDLSGWWRASVEHNGETSDLYLHLDTTADGHQRARFSIPMVRTNESGIGPYEVQGAALRFPALGWTLSIVNGAATLDGQIPEALAPLYTLRAHFERVAALPPLPVFTPHEQPPTPTWRVSTGAPIWAGLLHHARSLYVAGEDGRVRALDDHTGREIWNADAGSAVRATPVFDHGRLYVSADRALLALNASTGAVIWRVAFGAERSPVLPNTDQQSKWDHYGSSAVLAGGRLFVGSRDGCLYALERATGAQVWRHCTEDLITGAPAITANAVLFSSFDNHIYALSRRDGRVLWSRDIHGASPADLAIHDGAVFVGSRSYDFLALDIASGAPRWTKYFWWSWVDSPPVIVNGAIYIGSSDMLTVHSLDADTGRQIWAAPAPGWTWARVAVSAHSVYAGATGGTPYIAPRAGALLAYDRRSGALRWLFTPEHADDGSLYGFAASPAFSGNRLYAADLVGNVYCFSDQP